MHRESFHQAPGAAIAPIARHIDDQELASLIGVGVKTTRRWRLEGRGPRFRKYGRGQTAAVRYDLRDVQLWLDSLYTGGGSEIPATAEIRA